MNTSKGSSAADRRSRTLAAGRGCGEPPGESLRSLAMKARFVGPITLVLSLSLGAAALGDPTPAPHATPSPGVAVPDIPGVPPTVMNSPVVQSILNAAGGLLQTTNGPTAYGKITYFKRFDLQLQTAPYDAAARDDGQRLRSSAKRWIARRKYDYRAVDDHLVG